MARASTPAQASVVVMNTCTVTASADQDARAAIRRMRRQNPDAQIVVTGCYAQRAPEEIAALPGVSLVIGNSHKQQLAEIALNRVSQVPTDWDVRSDLCADLRSANDFNDRRPTIHLRLRHLRPYGTAGCTSLRRCKRAHPPHPESAGRMRQPLLVLRHPLRPWSKPFAAARSHPPRSERIGRLRLSRSRDQRNQSR